MLELGSPIAQQLYKQMYLRSYPEVWAASSTVEQRTLNPSVQGSNPWRLTNFKRIIFTVSQKLHFIGIAGQAFRGIAYAAKLQGYEVTGTDENAYPPGTDWLDAHGIQWWREPDPAHLNGVGQVIINSQYTAQHPEIVAAKAMKISVVSWAEFVGELIKNSKRIVISGTHGKTTTTSLVTWILEKAGRKPDFLIGAPPLNFDSTVRLTGAKLTVLEGDEYISSQLDPTSKIKYYRPDELVVTSLEMDHPDVFKDLSDIRQRFADVINAMPESGRLIYYPQSQAGNLVRTSLHKETYDLVDADWSAKDLEFQPTGLKFTVVNKDRELGQVEVPLFGTHNVLNCLAAVAVVWEEQLDWALIQQALLEFKGVAQRLQRITSPDAAVKVFNDYAHHPTEVKSTINAVRKHHPNSRIITVFQPHTYSRTTALLEEYRHAFDEADQTYIAKIEGAREAHLAHTVSGADIAAGSDGQIEYIEDREELMDKVIAEAKSGDVILVMTVNNFGKFAEELTTKLEK